MLDEGWILRLEVRSRHSRFIDHSFPFFGGWILKAKDGVDLNKPH